MGWRASPKSVGLETQAGRQDVFNHLSSCPDRSCSLQALVPWSGIKPRPCALGSRSPSHCTSREVPLAGSLCCSLEEEFFLLQETSGIALEVFNWLGEAHPQEEESSALQKAAESQGQPRLQAAARLVFGQTSGHKSRAKLSCKINHHHHYTHTHIHTCTHTHSTCPVRLDFLCLWLFLLSLPARPFHFLVTQSLRLRLTPGKTCSDSSGLIRTPRYVPIRLATIFLFHLVYT